MHHLSREPVRATNTALNKGPYRFIVLQYGTLEDEIPPFPTPEIFPPLGQITLLVPSRCDGLTGTNYIGREKRGDFVSVFDRKGKNSLKVVLQRDLQYGQCEFNAAPRVYLPFVGPPLQGRDLATACYPAKKAFSWQGFGSQTWSSGPTR